MPTHTLSWKEHKLIIIDQTLLPDTVKYIELTTVPAVWEAIKVLRIRGAPAIGICAAYGVVVAALCDSSPEAIRKAIEYLATSRPTAVNLFYALERMKRVLENSDAAASADQLLLLLEAEANQIFEEDVVMCRTLGEHGATLLNEGSGVLTHCNAGGLATSGYGTALAPMYVAHEQGLSFKVYADETRPLLQGARLTAWELSQAGIDVTLICDNMAAQIMREQRIDLVIVGADRIAANGDTANKIGTYGVAMLARAHNIPFYVAAPSSTFDMATPTGESIPIEQRDPDEVTHVQQCNIAPKNINVYNPAFDVTPADLIAGFITDRGFLAPPYTKSITDSIG
ncbi:MAG: S-methyl-5-thioribose-1-phosphate isomerase, partial [Candidatus Hydrogenedentes bacterium]|nr:S-methyl-5-thioribose-1-phosphate isomerase [Candidatus Hydrogenedentota bacterium]